MKSAPLAGLWPMSVSFSITLTQRNMQVSQVIMNALSDTWPFFPPPACLACSLGCILSLSSPLLHCVGFHSVYYICLFSKFNYLAIFPHPCSVMLGSFSFSDQFVTKREMPIFLSLSPLIKHRLHANVYSPLNQIFGGLYEHKEMTPLL